MALMTFLTKILAPGAWTAAKAVSFINGTEHLGDANARAKSLDGTVSNIAKQRTDATKNSQEEVANRKGKILSSPYVFKYPQDVGGDEQKHSVLFFINVRSNSRVGVAVTETLTDGGQGAEALQIAQSKLTAQKSGENNVRTENSVDSAKLTYAVGGAIAGAAIGASLMDGSSAFAKASLAIGSAIAAAGIADAVSETTTTYRLLSTIQLHVSAPPQTSYSAEWQNVDLGVAGYMASGGGASVEGFIAGAGDLASYAARQLIAGAAQLPKELAGINADFAGALDATQKKVANPYKEQLFKSMGFRKFAFNYKFAPKNTTELESVLGIIQLFKYHMHPEFDASRLFLKYPSEFNIEYHYENQENKYLSKISSCVLSDMKISYGGADFNTFKDTTGAPSEINIELLFTELETLTNDRIGQGPENGWLDLSSYGGGY